jgi:hypothetical protein
MGSDGDHQIGDISKDVEKAGINQLKAHGHGGEPCAASRTVAQKRTNPCTGILNAS